MNILLIGNGVYSTGRGSKGFGTILPSIIEWKRHSNKTLKLTVTGTNEESSSLASDKYAQLSDLTGIKLNIEFYPDGKKNNIKNYKDVIKSAEKPDCAIIVVPDHLHYKITKDCLLAGMHCLVVKPLVLSTKEAIELTQIAKDKNLHGVVEYHKRWDKSNLIIKEAVEKDLGDLLYCLVEYSQRKSVPSETFSQWAENSNVLNYLGIHYIDIMYFISKATPKRVMAVGQKNWLKDQNINTYDSIQCVIEWIDKSGNLFTQTLLLNWVDPETSTSMSDQKIKIIGTKGRVEADQKDRGIKINLDNSHLMEPNPDFCKSYKNIDGTLSWRGYGIDSVITFLSDIKNLKEEITNPDDLIDIRPTFKDSIVVTSIIEAANKSLNSKGLWENISK